MPVDEKSGVRYRVLHDRVYGPEQDANGDYLRSQKGGRTLVEIIDANDQVLATGESWARPDENYNRKLGKEIALGRALKALRKASADPKPEHSLTGLTVIEGYDLFVLAVKETDAAGVCFVHLDGGAPAQYVMLTAERYREFIGRIFDGGEIPVDDAEWSHSHVEPEMLRDVVFGGSGA